MRHPQAALSVLIAVSAILLAVAGSASASVLCSENMAPCGAKLGAGTELIAGNTTLIVFETTGGVKVDECTGGSLKAKTTTPGGETESVKATLSSWTWTCSKTTTTAANGELEIHASNVNGTGVPTLSGFEVNITTTVACAYGSNKGLFIGPLAGGKNATLQINAVLKKTAGNELCLPELRWTGVYTFSKPSPLWVEPK